VNNGEASETVAEFSDSELDHQDASVAAVTDNRAGAGSCIQIRDRIKELRRVRAKDLVRNPKNWRRHPKAQAEALRGLLAEVGYADALLARELPDGRLMIIDGHLRADTTPDSMVPVLVLDVTEEEADKILLTLDPLAAMAEADAERIMALLTTVRTDSEAVQELLKQIAGPKLWEILHPEDVEEAAVSPERADETSSEMGHRAGPALADRPAPHHLRRLHQYRCSRALDGKRSSANTHDLDRPPLRGRLRGEDQLDLPA
jgi:hypothetical protein